MEKILLLGSTGKLGKKVLKELLLKGEYEIGLLIRNLPDRKIDRSNNFQLFEGDITNKESLAIPFQWADVVINCTGAVSYSNKIKDIKKLQLINVDGVRNIADVCYQYGKKLIHTSSTGTYGCAKEPMFFQENDKPNVSYRTNYSLSKIAGEEIVLGTNIPKVILRPCSLISKEKSTIKSFYAIYKKGYIADLKGGASFALMDDAAKAYIPALELLKRSESNEALIFNLGGHNLTCKEVFASFKGINNTKGRVLSNRILYLLSILNDLILKPFFNYSIITFENYQNGSHYNFIDSSKAIKFLNYKLTPFDLALKEII